MKITIDNLNKTLSCLQCVNNFCDHFDYVKIDTNYVIDYCEEYLVLYAKIIDDSVFITDLNGILDDALLNNISAHEVKNAAEKNGLKFDGVSIFDHISLENIQDKIQQFEKVMIELGL